MFTLHFFLRFLCKSEQISLATVITNLPIDSSIRKKISELQITFEFLNTYFECVYVGIALISRRWLFFGGKIRKYITYKNYCRKSMFGNSQSLRRTRKKAYVNCYVLVNNATHIVSYRFHTFNVNGTNHKINFTEMWEM